VDQSCAVSTFCTPQGVTHKLSAFTLASILLATSTGLAISRHLDPGEGDLYEQFLELLLPAIIDPTTTDLDDL